MKLDNSNLSIIVNGYPDDPIELRPFDVIFMCQNIWKWWCKGQFIPMSQNALYEVTVSQQLGGEKTLWETTIKLELCVSEYEKIANDVILLGFRGMVLDLIAEMA